MAEITKWLPVKITDIKPYEKNAKRHPKDQVQKIADSIQEFGFVSPCIIDEQYRLIAGHGRLEAAKLLNLQTIPCVFVEGLSEEQRRAYIIADNKLTEIGEWDLNTLQLELNDLKATGFDIYLTGFTVDNLGLGDTEDIHEIINNDDDFEKAPEPKAKRGDIYQLGNHRLMCGDSTSEEDVQALVDENIIDLVETDPPYNVNYSTGKKHKDIENDNLLEDQFYQFLFTAFKNADSVLKAGGGVLYMAR